MFDLSNHVANKPIYDGPYLRHMRTADTFNAVQEARDKLREAGRKLTLAEQEYEAAQAFCERETLKAKIINDLENL